MKCCLCLVCLPSANKRRRLYGASSSKVLELFKVEATRLGLAGIVPSNSCASDGPFLCLPRFQQFEKLSKVRLNQQELESQLNAKITKTAAALKVVKEIEPSGNYNINYVNYNYIIIYIIYNCVV